MSQEHTQSLPGNSPVSGLPPTQPLWTDSAVLGGYFVYAPSTDEIYLRDGRRFPRPANLPRSALAIATYTGRLPPPSAGLPQHPLPVTGSPPTPIQMPMHPGSPQNPVSAMGSMRTYRGQIQEINAQKPVEVVFHHGSTQSQIMRREPPNIHARGVNIGKPEITSTLFKEYRVRSNPKQFFQVGTVFLVLWSEPAGGTSLVSKWAAGTVINHLGERVFSRVRRFVVIREGGNYCNALPINTYAGRGVAKPGVNKSEHAIIFTGRSPPLPGAQELPRRGEIGMRPVSIQVDPDSLDERLDPMSRLDLGGVTKVEHNIKVKSLGRVNRRSLDALRTQYAMVQGYLGGARDSSLPQHALHSSLRKFSDGFETRKVEGEGGKEVEDEDDEEDEEEDDEEDEDDDGDDESDDDDDGGSDDGTETPTSALVERNILAAAEPLTHISAARSKTRDSLSGSDRSENNKAQADSDKTGDDDMER